MNRGPYTVKVLDLDDCELSVTEEDSLKIARRCAHEKLRSAEYVDAGAVRALVTDGQGVCVIDMHNQVHDDARARQGMGDAFGVDAQPS